MVVAGFARWGKWDELQQADKLGSLLQGVFAPLAFGWLVIAVLLQTRELALQRQELRLNRQALELQAEELKKSVEQFTVQTNLLKNESDRATSQVREGELSRRLDRVARKIANTLSEVIEHDERWRLDGQVNWYNQLRAANSSQQELLRDGKIDDFFIVVGPRIRSFTKALAHHEFHVVNTAIVHDATEDILNELGEISSSIRVGSFSDLAGRLEIMKEAELADALKECLAALRNRLAREMPSEADGT